MDRRLILSALVAVLVALAPAGPAVAESPDEGDRVVLEGTLLDTAGAPVVGAVVLLEASSQKFSLRRLGESRGEPLQSPATTGEDGGFRFLWMWDDHYNAFELAFGLEVTREGVAGFEIVERRDVTAEMTSGAPPALRIELEDAPWLRWLQLFIDGRASAEEKKVYRQLGRPQKLTTDGAASSWWYFTLGKVYRFEGGDLDQIIPFEPIPEPPAADS